MQWLFALIELFDKFLDAILVIKCCGLGLGLTFVEKSNFQSRIQKRQFAQPLRDDVRLELRRLAENFRLGFESDKRAGVLVFADDMKLLNRFAALKLHVMH